MPAAEVETTISSRMRRSRFGAFVLGILLLALPASGTLTFCLDGTAPDCCGDPDRTATPAPDAGTSIGTGHCDCCIAIDTLPFDRGSSGDRFLATPPDAAAGLVVQMPFKRPACPGLSSGSYAAPSQGIVVLRV